MALRRSANFAAAWAPTCASRKAGDAPLRGDDGLVIGDDGNWLTLTK